MTVKVLMLDLRYLCCRPRGHTVLTSSSGWSINHLTTDVTWRWNFPVYWIKLTLVFIKGTLLNDKEKCPRVDLGDTVEYLIRWWYRRKYYNVFCFPECLVGSSTLSPLYIYPGWPGCVNRGWSLTMCICRYPVREVPCWLYDRIHVTGRAYPTVKYSTLFVEIGYVTKTQGSSVLCKHVVILLTIYSPGWIGSEVHRVNPKDTKSRDV